MPRAMRTRTLFWCFTIALLFGPVSSRRQQAVGNIRTQQEPRPAQKTVVRYSRQQDTPLTRCLLYGNCAAFVLLLRTPGLFAFLAKNDAAIVGGGQYHRLVTSTFLHAGAAHLFVNMNSLNNLGKTAEPWFGTRRLAATYLISGVAGNLLSLQLQSAPVSVGASGAIFGLLGAWAVFLKRNEVFFASSGVDIQRSLSSLMQSCALTAAIGFSPGSRIDNFGHLGGLVGGAACSYIFGPKLRWARSSVGVIAVDDPLFPLIPPKRKALPPSRMPSSTRSANSRRRPPQRRRRTATRSQRSSSSRELDDRARRVAGLA